MQIRRLAPVVFAAAAVPVFSYAAIPAAATASPSLAPLPAHGYKLAGSLKTATPIKHVVVIFQENVSFDHYFATYPQAANKS